MYADMAGAQVDNSVKKKKKKKESETKLNDTYSIGPFP